MTNIEPYRQKMKTNIKEHNDMVDKINEIVDVVNDTNLEAYAKLTDDVNALKSDVANINTKDNEQDVSIGAAESDIATLKTNDNYLSDKVEQMETDLIATEQAVATNQSDIAKLKGSDTSQNAKITAIQSKDAEQDTSIDNLVSGLASANNEITGLSTSLISDVEMTDGTNAGSVQVTLVREDNQRITSANYLWGRDIGARLQAGATPNTFKLLIDLSDGTVIESNEYLSSQEVVEGDIYVTAITLVPDVANGQLGGTISYSNGSTQTINKVAVPTSPGVTSSIEALQTRMTGVESKNSSQDTAITGLGTRLTTAEGKITTAQTDISSIKNKNIEQDGELTSLDARVTAIEDAPGIGKFSNSNLGTILGSTTDGFVSADAQGRGKVSGWNTLHDKVDTNTSDISSIKTELPSIMQGINNGNLALSMVNSALLRKNNKPNEIGLATYDSNGDVTPLGDPVTLVETIDTKIIGNKLEITINGKSNTPIDLPTEEKADAYENYNWIQVSVIETDNFVYPNVNIQDYDVLAIEFSDNTTDNPSLTYDVIPAFISLKKFYSNAKSNKVSLENIKTYPNLLTLARHFTSSSNNYTRCYIILGYVNDDNCKNIIGVKTHSGPYCLNVYSSGNSPIINQSYFYDKTNNNLGIRMYLGTRKQ